MLKLAKWNPGPFSHVWRFFTRRGRRRAVAGYDFDQRLAAVVARAEVEAAAVDRLLSARAR